MLERSIAELGIYPAVDPLASTSRILDPAIVGEEHYQVARTVQRVLQHSVFEGPVNNRATVLADSVGAEGAAKA